MGHGYEPEPEHEHGEPTSLGRLDIPFFGVLVLGYAGIGMDRARFLGSWGTVGHY